MSFKSYEVLFAEIKQKVAEAQLKTVVAANAQMLLLYWQMGNYILQNQQAKGWGAKIIGQLSADLKKEFPQLKGFSPRNLKYMRKFAENYSSSIIQQLILTEQQFKNRN